MSNISIQNYEIEAAGYTWIVPEYRVQTLSDGTQAVSVNDIRAIHLAVANAICEQEGPLTAQEYEFLCAVTEVRLAPTIDGVDHLLEALGVIVPSAGVKPHAPRNPKGHWFVDVSLNGHALVCEWSQTFGFGLSQEVGWGEGPDETFPNGLAALERVLEILRGPSIRHWFQQTLGDTAWKVTRKLVQSQFGDGFADMEKQAVANMLYWQQNPSTDHLGESIESVVQERDRRMALGEPVDDLDLILDAYEEDTYPSEPLPDEVMDILKSLK